MLKINDYEFLCTLHDSMNITQAAKTLFISQPALTKRLKQIEDDLDTVIVYRNMKGVVFTPEGEYIVSYCRQALEEYKNIKRVLHGFRTQAASKITIVSANTCLTYLLPALLGEFHRLHPEILLQLENAVSNECSHKVYNRQFDVGFVCGEPPLDLEKDLICEEHMTLVSKEEPDLSKLPYLPRIDSRMSSNSHNAINYWWRDHYDVPPYIGVSVSTVQNSIELIKQGLGYSIFFHSRLIQHEPGLHFLPLLNSDGSLMKRSNYLVHHKDAEEKESVRIFLDFCRKYFLKFQD